jgi:signal transduction histidine kinase
VSILADAFNALAERVAGLLEAERARVGDLSHRLRTPVTALRLDVEAVREPDVRDRLQVHIAHLQRSIDSIVLEARRPLSGSLRITTDATAVVEQRMRFWAALAEDQGRPLTVDLPTEPLIVPIDKSALTDVLDVLVDNVFAHTPDDVPFRVRLRRADALVRLDVTDEGPGYAPAATSAPALGRSGMGLHIVRRTLGAAGGELAVSDAHGGVAATVWLPLIDP